MRECFTWSLTMVTGVANVKCAVMRPGGERQASAASETSKSQAGSATKVGDKGASMGEAGVKKGMS